VLIMNNLLGDDRMINQESVVTATTGDRIGDDGTSNFDTTDAAMLEPEDTPVPITGAPIMVLLTANYHTSSAPPRRDNNKRTGGRISGAAPHAAVLMDEGHADLLVGSIVQRNPADHTTPSGTTSIIVDPAALPANMDSNSDTEVPAADTCCFLTTLPRNNPAEDRSTFDNHPQRRGGTQHNPGENVIMDRDDAVVDEDILTTDNEEDLEEHYFDASSDTATGKTK
jgi:hypothetical protein